MNKFETHDMATIGGAYIRNQDYKLKMEKCILCIDIQYSFFNTTPGKSSDPGGKIKAPKVEWNTKPGISIW